jgi:hypothetical protein
MTRPYKIIPAVLLVFYALCTVCPERVVPMLALQRAAASEAHDCHNRGRHKPESECRTAFSESLPTPEVKFSHVLTVHAFLLSQHFLSLAFDLSLRLRTIHFSTAGPPIASLNPKLRI